MASKRQRRTEEVRSKKSRKAFRIFFFLSLILVVGGFFAFLFFTLSDQLFPMFGGKVLSPAKREKKEVILYFSDANERFLVPEKRLIAKEDTAEKQAEGIVRALIEGSKTGLVRTLPEGSKLLNIKIDKGVAQVSFDRSLIDLHPGSTASEMATVYSLTNTLTRNLLEIKKVKFLIDGKETATIKGHLDTMDPVSPFIDLIKEGRAGG
jgi:germination protein M